MRSIRFIFALLLCYIPAAKSQYVVEQISNIDGLSNSSINCLMEDSHHILWIGTWDGLNAYDGREVKTYRYHKDSKSISHNIIRSIVEQDNMNVWITTDGGLNRWCRKTQTFDRFFERNSNILMAVTANSTIVCCINKHWYYFDETRQEFIEVKREKNLNINNIHIDKEDNIYTLLNNKIVMKGRIVYENHIPRITEETLLYEGENVLDLLLSGNKLIINCGSYLEVMDKDDRNKQRIESPHKTIAKISYRNELLFMNYSSGGCAMYDFEKNKLIPLNDISADIPVFSIHVGSQGILWIGTDGKGVLKVYKYSSPFNKVFTEHHVRCFCESDDDHLLVGTKGEGIKILDKKRKVLQDFLTTGTGLNSNDVYTIRKNKYGDFFVGTDGLGLAIIQARNNKVQYLEIPDSTLKFRSVYSILFTHNDSLLWLGAVNYGLLKIELKRENGVYKANNIHCYYEGSLNNTSIYSLVKGKDDNEIWISTRKNGLFKLNVLAEHFDKLEELNRNLSSEDILCIKKGKNDKLWIGTGYGLNSIDLTVPEYPVTNYADRQEFVNNTIHGILEDKDENLWTSTNHGICFLNTKSGNIINYTSLNGLHNDEFSDGSFYSDSDNILYFGGVGGFSYFRNDEIHLRDYIPPLHLNQLRINNVSQNVYERIKNNTLHLSYNEPFATLTFLSGDFINNENCEYAYRISGYADEWVANGNNPNVLLTRLPPGQYILDVKCTNGDRVWSDDIYSLNIQADHPWWHSVWAYVIYMVLLVGTTYVIIFVIRNRLKRNRQVLLDRIEKENQERMHESKLNFFTNIAHEFFTPLTLIYGPASHLLEKANLDNLSKKYIKVIKNNADRMQKLINELMEFRKAESGFSTLRAESINIEQLMNYISDNYAEIAAENKIDFHIHMEENISFVTDRSSLEKIIFNLISNAFKYTPLNGYIQIFIYLNETTKQLNFRIRNSGKGLTDKHKRDIFDRFSIFEESRLKHSGSIGIGLNLTKSLVELLGGEIKVDSRIDEYVEFSVVLKPIIVEGNGSEDPVSMALSINPENILTRKDITVLIVEDERGIRELLKDILEPYYRVITAENGKDGIEILNKDVPDIVICDIIMPELDGIGFIDHLKGNLHTAHIHIISISAKNSIDDHISAFRHGADLYINKPFQPRHVLAAVENIINKHFTLKKYFNSSRSEMMIKEGIQMHQEENTFLQNIVRFIEDNVDNESLSPTLIAETTGVSKASLYDKMKKIVGKTPSEYIRYIRLEYASRLLKTTQLTVSEIMFKSGFASRSYFYKEFSKEFGVSPKEYRKKEE
ncbi:hybrid sensor histidine kinase/response regulator transcription factor [Prevotella sp. 10(H)]|uniref:hybrid sensor histidine kinase/response regulator transcription factor n=1 Tax=Prevotella sp. 10(H) TaxID=1158294 RepID=UPI0004A6EA9B|nr:hybrid sensor histidine kinase/response regulator transcription factor [Prevotella sp. 10(H)]